MEPFLPSLLTTGIKRQLGWPSGCVDFLILDVKNFVRALNPKP